MEIIYFFQWASLMLSARAVPQDFNGLFSVYAGNLSATGRQFYGQQYVIDTIPQPIDVHPNSTQGSPDFDDDDPDSDQDDEMEDFFYENGFVQINNDNVYDYSYVPKKPSNSSLGHATSAYPDAGEQVVEEIVEETPDVDEENGEEDDQPSTEFNSTSTQETSLDMDGTDSPVDFDHETNYDGEDLEDHVIPLFVHPINRPSSEWPLNQTQVGKPTNLNHRKPVRRRPVRRRRPQGNRRPQKGGHKKRRRRKPQNGNRRPIKNNKRKKPIRLTPIDPNVSSVNQFFDTKSCGTCQCGVTTTRRIVGGTIAAVNEFPWLALIAYNGSIQCGGTLINDRFVLTAAHCVRGFSIRLLQLRFLEYNRATNAETMLVIRRAARIYTLDTYRASTADNDIGLIRLSSPIVFATTTVRPICLPVTGTVFTGATGTVAGWGTTRENGNPSRILRKARVPIISNSQCTLIGMRITRNMLCAGRLLSGGIDACQGDSGGPLMVVRSRRYILAGVVSWGDGCARPRRPGVYTRVTNYLPWIRRFATGSCTCF